MNPFLCEFKAKYYKVTIYNMHSSYLYHNLLTFFTFRVLSDNSLSKIDSDAFIGLHKLRRLSLHNCGLTVIPAEALKHVNGLSSL